MRAASILGLVAAAFALAGCSIIFDASDFQGGTADAATGGADAGPGADASTAVDADNDAELPRDDGGGSIDGALGEDARVDAAAIDAGLFDAGPRCTMSSDCAAFGATFVCAANVCTDCDADRDTFVLNRIECMPMANGPPDCNDGDAMVYPGAFAICGDSKVNSCDSAPEAVLRALELGEDVGGSFVPGELSVFYPVLTIPPGATTLESFVGDLSIATFYPEAPGEASGVRVILGSVGRFALVGRPPVDRGILARWEGPRLADLGEPGRMPGEWREVDTAEAAGFRVASFQDRAANTAFVLPGTPLFARISTIRAAGPGVTVTTFPTEATAPSISLSTPAFIGWPSVGSEGEAPRVIVHLGGVSQLQSFGFNSAIPMGTANDNVGTGSMNISGSAGFLAAWDQTPNSDPTDIRVWDGRNAIQNPVRVEASPPMQAGPPTIALLDRDQGTHSLAYATPTGIQLYRVRCVSPSESSGCSTITFNASELVPVPGGARHVTLISLGDRNNLLAYAATDGGRDRVELRLIDENAQLHRTSGGVPFPAIFVPTARSGTASINDIAGSSAGTSFDGGEAFITIGMLLRNPGAGMRPFGAVGGVKACFRR